MPSARWPRSKASVPLLAVLHPAFALTGVLHAAGGPVLPSLAFALHLSDSQSGLLFLAYFAGTSVGALLCGRRPAPALSLGFAITALTCAAIAFSPWPFLEPAFLLLGIAVGMPMTAVSMIAGRRFADRSAAPLTLLNCSWSAGALIAPLLAARLLLAHTYRAAYLVLGVAAAVAALACCLFIDRSTGAASAEPRRAAVADVRLVALFALLTFLEVGVENTTASWLATFAQRTSGLASAGAAALSSLYWLGFVAARVIASLVLLRTNALRVLTIAVCTALLGAALLIALPGAIGRGGAMIFLGAALAPIFPLLLATFFARAGDASDSRWVLAVCGFGGSILPWLTGLISSRTGSLRLGLLTVPAALLLIVGMLPLLAASRTRSGSQRS